MGSSHDTKQPFFSELLQVNFKIVKSNDFVAADTAVADKVL